MSTTQRIQSPACRNSLRTRVDELRQITYMHVMESTVDLLELAVMRDVLIDLDFAS